MFYANIRVLRCRRGVVSSHFAKPLADIIGIEALLFSEFINFYHKSIKFIIFKVMHLVATFVNNCPDGKNFYVKT